MRKKYVVSALAGALILALAAVAVATPQLTQKADVKLVSKKVKTETAVKADLVENDPGAQPPGNFPSATKVVIKLPKGTLTNTNAHPQCNLSDTEVANGQCPANTKVGDGNAVVNVVIGTAVFQNVPATITAYNAKNALRFRVVSQATTQLPSTTVPITSQLKGRTLTTNVPVLRPAGPNSKVILTEFHVTIDKHGKGKGKKRKSLVKTPATCTGQWTTKSTFTYDDGTTKSVTFKQNCTKPKKKKKN